jgi:transposase-like protein
VARLSEAFEAWRGRDLASEDIAIVFPDGFGLKMRWGGRVESVPVLAALGVSTDGRRMLLGLEVRTSESAAAWSAMTEDLARRGVRAPVLAVIDGNAGLREAIKTTWPWIEVQRCTKHKLENLATHAPKRQYEAVKPNGKTVAEGSYPLSKPLVLCLSPRAGDTAKDFARFILSGACDQTFRQHRFVPAGQPPSR